MPDIKVVIVEDERIVALNLRQQLTKLGYKVVGVAASGEQALRQIEEHRPDIVLMDVHIEGPVDGIETARLIPPNVRVPIIYLTAYSEDATLERAKATRAYAYLLKPYAERELHATIRMVLERHWADEAARESEERLRLALDAADMGSWELDLLARKILHMERADRIFGFPKPIYSGDWDSFVTKVANEDRQHLDRIFELASAAEGAIQVEFRGKQVAGTSRWFRAQCKAVSGADSGDARLIGVIQDITRQKDSEERVLLAASVLEATRDGVLILDPEFRALVANRSYCAMTGHEPADLLAQVPYLMNPQSHAAEIGNSLVETVRATGSWRGETRVWRSDSTPFPAIVSIAPVLDQQQKLTHYIVIISDITAVRHAEKKLQHLAHHDALTDLPNRLLALDRLEHAIAQADRDGSQLGLLFLDLDHFKRINDTLGHSAGDALLRVIADRMRHCLRAEDTVARLGGDEFMLILERIEPKDAALVAAKLIDEVARPVTVAGREVVSSASIGIGIFPDDGATGEELIGAADMAMYAAKEQGRSRYTFFDKRMMDEALRQLASERELRRALADGELRLYYQPQLSMRTGEVVGAEGLIRWQHPDRGLLGAGAVIPVAERSSLIIEIGDWVLQQACAQVRTWREAGLPPLRVSVNASAHQVQGEHLVKVLEAALERTGIDPRQIEVEITESTIQNEAACIATLHALRNLGVGLAIDDFGTGYSCLNSLKLMPIDRLKIDQAFMRDIPDDVNDIAIAEAIIAMARRLHLNVIAEGVESAAQVAFLQGQECDEVQGYFYSRPLPPLGFAEFVRGRHQAQTAC